MQKIKDLVYYNRKEIITVLLCTLLFGSIFLFSSSDSKDVIIDDTNDEFIKDTKEESTRIVVDIKGEVVKPGTYEFNIDDRISDAIEKSGGLTEKADTSQINLSEKLSDEMLIIIPSVMEEETIDDNFINEKSTTSETSTKTSTSTNNNTNINTTTNSSTATKNNTTNNSNSNSSNVIKKESTVTTKSSSSSNSGGTIIVKDSKISINTASVSELMTIKGIGETKAKAIVDYRNTNGLFKDISDITKVSGIGNSTFEKIKDYIKV